MYKKALSLLLALMLIVTSLSVALVTVAAAGEDGNASVVKVTATSNVFPESEASFTQDQLDAQNNKVTVTYFIQSKLDMINADWKLTYDGTVLKCDEADNPNVMPHASGAFINFHPKSEEYGIKGNCTSLNAYDLEDGSGNRTAYVTVTFTVIGTGDTTVNLNVSDMLVVDDAKQETQLVNNSVLNSEVTDYTAQAAVYAGPYDDDYVAPTEASTEAPATDAPATEAPATDAPATDAPATDAPVTEPATDAPVVEDTLIVAGSEAEIFGTGWDGTNEANLMTKQGDGTYTKEYTVDKAYTAVQLKSVKNGAEWIGDETGNNVTFNLTGPGTFTVIYDPEANVTTVQGDIVEFITDFTYETVSAAGNGEGMWLNGASWDPAYVANEMTEVAEGIWEIEFTNVPDGFERQIKFCIDGAWTHNFGGAFEESGVATDAVYNGDNITFDTDDTCTVKAQLDLTNFDFTTKEGAKFTITITYDEEPTEAPATEAPATDAPATEAPATEAPATDAPATDAPATDAPADKFTVKGTSNFFPESVLEFEDLSTYEDENGNVFVAVEYSLDAPGKSLINADVALTWDKNVLEYKEAYNQSNGMLNFFPFAVEQGMGAGMVNTFDDSNNGRIRANYTNISPAAKAYDDITVVKAVFKVLDRTAGETVVNCYVDAISLDDDTATQPGANYSLVNGGVVDEELSKTVGSGTAIMTEEPEVPATDAPATDAPATDAPATDAPATDAPATDAPATDAPATDAPTTEPVVEDTLIVAGSEAEIFGTAWDGTNEVNLMTKQDDGTYTKEYTVDKAYTAVQLKSVKNGAEWIGDETGNNVTFNLTGPGTFTVIYDPEANVTTVEGDIVEFITDFTYDTVYAAGNGEGTWLNGASWDPAYVGNEMTEVADDIWEIEFTDVPDGFERQIKFCIDGAWTHNFGGAFEESGVATDAAYNGDNITFDTDDTCTVKAQLDLTNFDFTTKEGAKFTITITYDEEPTDAPATEAPATEAPATEAPATEAPATEAPATEAPATEAPATEAPATEAPATEAPAANLTVDGTSNYSPAVAAQTVKAGDTVTVTFKAPEDADIINIQWGMNYDTDKLELTSVSSFTPDMLVNTDATSFNAMGSVSNIDTPYSVWADDDFVTFTFTAKADGETTVDFRVIDMTYREDDEDKEAFVNEVDVRGEEPVTEPATEPATDAPATDAPATDAPATEAPATEAPATDAPATEAPATDAPAGDLTVNGISNYSPNVASQTVKTGETVTVTFKAPEDANIVDIQWGAIFDADKLELNSVSSFTADMLVNNNPESYNVMGSVSNITTPYSVLEDDDFVTFTFTAKADGETTVDFRVIDLTYRTDNGDEIAFENEVDKRGGEEPGTEPATDAPATDAPATDAPATDAPATDAPATDAPATDAPATDAPATDAPATDAPATDAPATAPATDAPATDAPATDAPATDAPATDAPATDAPATDAPATDAPATDAPATEAPATEAPATEAPATEAPATTPEGVIGYAIVFPDGTTIDLERSDDGTFKTVIPEDRFEDGKVEFKVVQKNDDNTTTDVLDNASYDATGKGNAVATYDFVNNTITLTFTGEEPPATSSTDATSATTPGGSTSDSGSTPDGGSNSGAVQTGNASMALIILLVLVSATAGIYFARKKVK